MKYLMHPVWNETGDVDDTFRQFDWMKQLQRRATIPFLISVAMAIVWKLSFFICQCAQPATGEVILSILLIDSCRNQFSFFFFACAEPSNIDLWHLIQLWHLAVCVCATGHKRATQSRADKRHRHSLLVSETHSSYNWLCVCFSVA